MKSTFMGEPATFSTISLEKRACDEIIPLFKLERSGGKEKDSGKLTN